ncbi:MAG: hypothetical protein F6K26_43860 [Moorea sp. SIO2I5]|nr:hypothetical protein [Moorena sp. SIO2I5]
MVLHLLSDRTSGISWCDRFFNAVVSINSNDRKIKPLDQVNVRLLKSFPTRVLIVLVLDLVTLHIFGQNWSKTHQMVTMKEDKKLYTPLGSCQCADSEHWE